MSAPAFASLVSVEQYLRDPAYRRCEYVGGRIVRKPMGTKEHGRLQGRCFRMLDEYFDSRPGGYASVELHCRFLIDGEVRFRLPDVCAVLERDDEPESPYLERAPDLAVEVRSPEDKVSDILLKLDEYFQAGTRLAWVVLPEEQAVLVRTADGRLTVATIDDSLDGGDVLQGLALPVAELFR
jgi:Uma2 family endonuclease